MKHIILTLAFTLSFLGCNRNSGENDYNPQLPPITQTGANTFGAVINGKVMVPRNSIGYIPPGSDHYAVDYYESNEYEEILAADSRETQRGWVYVYLKNPFPSNLTSVGSYPIGNSNGTMSSSTAQNTCITAVYKGKNATNPVYLSIENTGLVTLTKNDNLTISGTFSCKLKNKDNPNDIIEITDGRFDFNKNTINTTNFP